MTTCDLVAISSVKSKEAKDEDTSRKGKEVRNQL
jgi:hypothetical protein